MINTLETTVAGRTMKVEYGKSWNAFKLRTIHELW